MAKWEYKTVYFYRDDNVNDNVGTRFTEFGKDGWELVAIDTKYAYFKRPLDPNAPLTNTTTKGIVWA